MLALINIPDQYTEGKGIHDVFLARTLPSQAAANEVLYDDPGLGPSAVDWPGRSYASDDLVPYPHGGFGFSTEIMDSGGGLMSTAKALVQFASRYPVQGIGKERVINSRNGAMPGTNSVVYSHPTIKLIMHSYLTHLTKFRDRELISLKKSTTFWIQNHSHDETISDTY